MIFGERPLGRVLIALLCGFSLFASFPTQAKLILLFATSVSFSLLFLPRFSSKGKILRLPLLFLAVGLLLSVLYFDLYFPMPRTLSGEQTVTATVVDIDDSISYKRSLTLKTSRIGDRECYYRIRCDLSTGMESSTDAGFEVSNVAVGDELRIVATLESFGTSSSGFDFDSYYLSRGISAYADVKTLVARTASENPTLGYRIKRYRLNLCERIDDLAGEVAGGFLSAVLLGERDEMSDSLKHDFERLGISHLLALSGMHLAIISGIFTKLLALAHVGKKGRCVFLILFSLSFSVLTGCSPSVVRAAAMITIASLLFLFGYSHDALTSLSVAVTLIVIVTPYSAQNVGLWLSALSCFGIIFGSRLLTLDADDRARKNQEKFTKEEKKQSRLSKMLLAVRNTVLVSCFAVLATAILNATVFGRISLLSALTTPAFTLILEAYLFLGTAMLILGKLLPIGMLLRYFYLGIRDLCENLSDIEGVYVSSSSVLCVVIGILIAVAFLFFLFIRIRKPSVGIVVFFILTIAFYSAAYGETAARRNRETVVYASNGTNEFVFISTEGKTAVVDLNSQNVTTAYVFDSLMKDEGLCDADVYIATSYSTSLANSMQTILSKTTVRKLLLPTPKNADERAALEKILYVAAGFRCELDYYDEGESLGIGKYSFIEICREASGDGKRKILTLLDEENVYTYLSAGVLEGDTKTVAEPLVESSHTLIYGCHGSDYEYYHKIEEKPEKLQNLLIMDEHIAAGEEILQKCKVTSFVKRYVIR